MMCGCSLIFAVAALLINFSVAFHQHGNFSSGDMSLMVNDSDNGALVMIGYDKSVASYSLLSDDSSPGLQDGMDVEFVGIGRIYLTLDYDLVFEIPDLAKCSGKEFGICFDSPYAPNEYSRHFCSDSQCYLKVSVGGFPASENSNLSATLDHFDSCPVKAKSAQIKYPEAPTSTVQSLHNSTPDESASASLWYETWWLIMIIICIGVASASACKPNTENGMIQMNVLDSSCPMKAKSAQIKYSEVPSTTVKSLQNSAFDEPSSSASLWYETWWFILIFACICVALILGVAAGILFFYLKKRNSAKAPSYPSSAPFADAPTIETLFKESERRENLKAEAARKKKKNDEKKMKSHMKKTKKKDPSPVEMTLYHISKITVGAII